MIFLCVLTYSVSANEKKELVIVNITNFDRTERAIKIFEKSHPEYTVTLREETDGRVLAMDLTTKGQIDLFASVNLMLPMPAAFYYQTGSASDLSQFPNIMQYMNEYIDFNSIISYKDAIWGIPDYFCIEAWEVNDQLISTIGLSIPDGFWTWSDFAEIGRQIMQYNKINNTSYKLLADNEYAPFILQEINMNAIDITTKSANYTERDIIESIDDWLYCKRNGLLTNININSNIMPTNAVFYYDGPITYMKLADRHYIYPPAINTDTKYPVKTYAMMLNSNSNNINAAADFLSIWFSPEAMAADPIQTSGLMFRDESNHFVSTLWNTQLPSETNKELWKNIIKNGIADYTLGDLSREQWNTLYPKLINNEISSEEFAMLSEIRANMILGE